MRVWSKVIKPMLDFFGHIETIGTLKIAFWPLVLSASAVVSGYLGSFPLMWIIMAATLTFMGAAVGILNASQYRERRNPINKVMVRNTIFFHNLADMPQENRQIRRGIAKAKVVVALPPRRIIAGQLGMELLNIASFPIAIAVTNAETIIENKTPPRATFPKPTIILQPGAPFWIHDDPITLNLPCGVLKGRLDIAVKYGKPGREMYSLRRKGEVEIFLGPDGLLRNVYFHPDADSPVLCSTRHKQKPEIAPSDLSEVRT